MLKIAICAALLTGAGVDAVAEARSNPAIPGSSQARGCFEAAQKSQELAESLKLCDAALAETALPMAERVATMINRGIVNMQAKQYDAAIVDFDAAIALRPETAEAYINKGVALLRRGDRDREAVAMLSEGIERGPQKPAVAYFTRGIANEALGRTRDAYDDYSRAAQLAPDWADPVVELRRFQTVRRKTAEV